MNTYNENILELTTLDWLSEQGYEVLHGPEIDPDSKNPLRSDYDEVVLEPVLRESIVKINGALSDDIIDDAVKQVMNISHPNIVEANRVFHRMLTDGVDVSYRNNEGESATAKVYLIDSQNVENNGYMAINQVSIRWHHVRRPDVIGYINGLPLILFELKHPGDEHATIGWAYNQIQTYKRDIPKLFTYTEVNVISDGTEAKAGSLTANRDRYMSWKSTDGNDVCSPVRQLECLCKGMMGKERIVDIIMNYILFQSDGEKSFKILAAYHQYFAVNKAIASTAQAIESGERKGWVVWHTQGSGKSFSMVFYAGWIIRKLWNPTVVVLTDRNDLDLQLFDTFWQSHELFRQKPVRADSREKVKELLAVASWGIVFTTIQKFGSDDGDFPALSERKDIVVVADEAHRTQYGLSAKVRAEWIKYGFAKYMRDALPNATFIWFTGTPVASTDKNTVAVFGKTVDSYDISRAVDDNATVPIYYEARLAKIDIDEDQKGLLDNDFDEVTEWEEENSKEKMKSRWARLEAMVWAKERLDLIAGDIIEHFGKRNEVMDGKWMVVTMSRRIAVDLYNKIVAINPDWHSDDLYKWSIKIIMTGSASDPEEFQPHIYNKKQRDDLAKRVKDINDPLKLVIVRDMWLTGFDVPSMHTMYVDKPMKGHNLMQAIARVNRVYKDKQAWLIVDYIGIAYELKEALSYYSDNGDDSHATTPIEQAIAVMKDKYSVVQDMYHGYDYRKYFNGTPSEKTEVFSGALEHIFGLDDGKKRYVKAVNELGYAFSIAMPSDEAEDIRDDVGLFQGIKAAIMKFETSWWGDTGTSKDEYEHAIKQIVSDAVKSAEVMDLFSIAGIKKPDISVLSDEFLDEVQWMRHKNLALELLKKLLNNQIKGMTKKNLVKSKSFALMLEKTMKKYQNRSIESAQVIAELIELAKKIKVAQAEGEELWLDENEIAFYDALADNKSAEELLWDEVLKEMARELLKLIKENTSIDWTKKADIQAKLRVKVKRLLKKYKYPPDLEDKAIDTVITQAKLKSEELAREM